MVSDVGSRSAVAIKLSVTVAYFEITSYFGQYRVDGCCPYLTPCVLEFASVLICLSIVFLRHWAFREDDHEMDDCGICFYCAGYSQLVDPGANFHD
jgi:hypothetical protein